MAFLETTANPLILSLGDKRTATQRLNLAQAFNPVGSLLGMLTAQLVVINALRSSDYDADAYAALDVAEQSAIRTADLDLISTPYIGLGVLVLVIAGIIAVTKFPAAYRCGEAVRESESWSRLKSHPRYIEGRLRADVLRRGTDHVLDLHLPVRRQPQRHARRRRPTHGPRGTTWRGGGGGGGAMVCFLLGRWLCTYLMRTIDGARLMLYFAIGAVAFCAGTIFIGGMAGLFSPHRREYLHVAHVPDHLRDLARRHG